MQSRIRIMPYSWTRLLLVCMVLVPVFDARAGFGLQPCGLPAAGLQVTGISNFGRVSEYLYRGGQPDSRGFEELRQMGIDIVVDFCGDSGDHERREVESRGMRFVPIPWSALHRPDDRQVAQFLSVLQQNPERRVFAHCHYGSDRTGVMVAAYRIVTQGWTAQQALDEMKQYKFHAFWYRHLKSYVRELPEHLRSNPVLQTLHSQREAAH